MLRAPVMLIWLASATPGLAAGDWPALAAPENARVVSVAESMKLNGFPTKIRRFSVDASVDDVLQRYRSEWGKLRVENEVGPFRVIGRQQGDYYMSVQVRALDAKRAEGYLAITDIRAGYDNRNRPLGYSLPAESSLLSDMEAEDLGRASRHLTLTNRHSVDTNAQFFKDQLAARALHLEREAGTGKDGDPSRTLFFRGAGREAIVVISKRANDTVVVLNTISDSNAAQR